MRFTLSCTVTVSAYTIVEADTLADAIEIAEGRQVEIGGEREGVDDNEVWSITDADGQPENIHGEDEA